MKLLTEIQKSTDKVKLKVAKKADRTVDEVSIGVYQLMLKESEFDRVRKIVAELNNMEDDALRQYMAKFNTHF